VGSVYQKRIDSLKANSSDEVEGIGFFKVFFLSVLLFLILGSFLSEAPDFTDNNSQTDNEEYDEDYEPLWEDLALDRVRARSTWLNYTVIGILFSGIYEGIGESVIDFSTNVEDDDEVEPMLSPSAWFSYFAQAISGSFLRTLFALLTFWPFWLLSILIGYFLIKKGLTEKPSKSVLGYCGRPGKPFYSGIYGPLKPNNSISGIDYSCPNLVCPEMEKESVALDHSIVAMLKKYRAFNQTNLELTQIILAHKDYPSEVLEERSAEEEDNEEVDTFVTNESGKLEDSAKEGLKAVLEAHMALAKYHKGLKNAAKKSNSEDSEGSEGKSKRTKHVSFKETSEKMEKLGSNLSPLGKILLSTLVPSRGRAIASVPPSLVASCYLALEAGKSLVFDPMEDRFTCASIYPHLQARAVLQSLQSFHSNYKGDGRLIARQAIICSRRHGDFGRAFLPINMPIQSRAIRDWLEILYTPKDRRANKGLLIELDAHIEELNIVMKDNLSKKLEDEADPEVDTTSNQSLWKGLSYKSVVLFPLNSLLEITFANVEKAKLIRIADLMDETRSLQETLSISARLPGFKRQAMEAAKCKTQIGDILSNLKTQKGGEKLVEKWTILRRMLTRYNWLSTRIGDDAVPPDGLVQTILIDRFNAKNPEVIGLDAVVPMRHRRFKELLGDSWEKDFFQSPIHPRDVEICIEPKEFEPKLSKKMIQAQNGSLGSRASSEAKVS